MRSKSRSRLLLRAAAFGIATLTSVSGRAAEPALNAIDRTTYGDDGILEMPSARMDPDGSFFLTVGAIQGAQRFNFAFQALPWFQANFRYSHLSEIRGIKDEYDRSFGFKIRLFDETRLTPEVSLGIRDLLGTGIYSSEYLVATKQIYDVEVTTGLGWGRLSEQASIPNVFAVIFPSFKNRQGFTATGTPNFGQYFHGPDMGVFSGLIWHTPIENLNLLAEYSTDAYREETAGGTIKIRTPFNVGLSYRLYESLSVSAGWLYGTSYGLTLSIGADATRATSLQRFGPDLPEPVIRTPAEQMGALTGLLRKDVRAPSAVWVTLPKTPAEQDMLTIASAMMSEGAYVQDVDLTGKTLLVDSDLAYVSNAQCAGYAKIVANLDVNVDTVAVSNPKDPSGRVTICPIARPYPAAQRLASDDPGIPETPAPASVEAKIRRDLAAQNIGVEAIAVEQSTVWLYMRNYQYESEAEAAGRAVRVLMIDSPASVEIFRVTSVKNGIPMREFQISRTALERAATVNGTTSELGDAVSVSQPPLSNPILDRQADLTYPRFTWSIGPGLREGLFDPDEPFEVQLFGSLDAGVQLTPNLTLETRLEANIYNNFNLSRPSNSVLPHVRSDIIKYLRDGADGINKLDGVYRTRLTPDIYFEAKAGYLESMFAGAGAQALWRPDGGRFALGADLYEVWQRDFDELFGLQRYHVLTGHVTAYYNSPWYGLNFAVHAGRYLAGDYGATFEVTRQFSTGVEIGAFATFTNVPFSKFGEGSFDKGIIVHIPFEWALPIFSQSSYDLILRSLTRDGGQRLAQDDSLFTETHRTSFGTVEESIGNVVDP